MMVRRPFFVHVFWGVFLVLMGACQFGHGLDGFTATNFIHSGLMRACEFKVFCKTKFPQKKKKLLRKKTGPLPGVSRKKKKKNPCRPITIKRNAHTHEYVA